MDKSSVADRVRRYFSAYRSRDRQFVESELADDFTFTSPYDDRIGREEYFARCWPGSERIRAHRIERIVGCDDAAFVLYECELTSGVTFRNVEHFVFEGGKLSRVEVYFGDPPAGVPRDRYAELLDSVARAWKSGRPPESGSP